MTWDINATQGSETRKIVWEVAPYLRGRGIDLGAGYFKVLPQAISVDDGTHNDLFGHSVQADLRMDASKLDLFADGSLDFVYSSHLLEHIENYKAALKEWWRVVKIGGKLALYLPHKDFYPNIGVEGANPDHKHDFLPKDIIGALDDICIKYKYDLLECQERNNDEEYSMLLVFKKIEGRYNLQSHKKPKPSKSVLVCRFGAFGDLMQASPIFAGLKDQGYHVTLMTSMPGAEVISQDPNIDSIMLLDKDQIPNGDLGNFWKWQAKKYDKFVNLSESVEGTFLAMPGRMAHSWTPKARESLMNLNYVQFQCEIAGIEHRTDVKFYATNEEKEWAKKERSKMGEFTILWSLAGSSVHKTWAGLDNVIAALMLQYENVHVVLCGGQECVILEAGWENEPRVHLTCGKWNIRQSLAFIAEADMVIGPETGVLNAAANEPMPKILFLSHSTIENLSRDWKNTVSLYGIDTHCKGRENNEAKACHTMHYGWEFCTKSEEHGVAQCQVDIKAQTVTDFAMRYIDDKLKRAA